MKEFLKTIKEHFILLLGTGLFTYGLFSFNSSYYLSPRWIEASSFPITTYYYYSQISLSLLVVGAIFIVMGLLKVREKRGES